MGIGDFFSKINERMDSGFQGFITFLTDKGIPAQRYVDFLESKGIPAMWFSILMVALIVAIIVLLITVIFSSTTVLTVSVMTDTGCCTMFL